jgi:moderate conductance mechanosensitive channel
MFDVTKGLNDSLNEVGNFFSQPNAFRSMLILVASVIIVYWLSRFIAKAIIKIAQIVASHSDEESDVERKIRLRQIETYLSVTVAIVRAILAIVIGYIAWRLLSPSTSGSIAAIGAGTFFVVFAGQTLGIILRDITAGATIIIEKWFNVGDFIKVEPFMDVAGIVERLTLRSTRIRTLSGEVVWIHNQQIMAAHVTPQGVRTLAVDLFVHDKDKAQQKVEKIIKTIPTGPLLLAKPLQVTNVERWGDDMWRIIVTGQTAPGREWLIENYFINALTELDEGKKRSDRLLIHDPIVRYADPTADRRFRRAIRTHQDK